MLDCKSLGVSFGRLLVIDGISRATSAVVGKTDTSNPQTTWNIDQTPSILANSSLNQVIAMEFSNQANGEHASVASFARHTLQLMTMEAPPTLLMGSIKAAVDEIRHAKNCYGIAETFLGKNIQPSTLDIDGSLKALSK